MRRDELAAAVNGTQASHVGMVGMEVGDQHAVDRADRRRVRDNADERADPVAKHRIG